MRGSSSSVSQINAFSSLLMNSHSVYLWINAGRSRTSWIVGVKIKIQEEVDFSRWIPRVCLINVTWIYYSELTTGRRSTPIPAFCLSRFITHIWDICILNLNTTRCLLPGYYQQLRRTWGFFRPGFHACFHWGWVPNSVLLGTDQIILVPLCNDSH